MRLALLPIYLIILIPRLALLQSQYPADTLEAARQKAYAQNYSQAIHLLEAYESNHPWDINAIRLHVQLLYWMKDFNAVIHFCELNLKKNTDPGLKLDYARILFELNKISKAKKVTGEYLRADKLNPEANNMLGTIAYWEGKPAIAVKYFQSVLKLYPGNEWALAYLKEIKENTAAFLSFNSGYTDDSQPLNSTYAAVELGRYFSNLFEPKLNLRFLQYSYDSKNPNTFSTSLSNKISLFKIKTDFLFSVGIFKFQQASPIEWGGEASLRTQLLKNLFVGGVAAHKPYLYTLKSLDKGTFYNSYAASLSYENNRSWTGKAEFNLLAFPDANEVRTTSVWLLSPPLSLNKFKLRVGYGFNYSDSGDNRFMPVRSISEIISSGMPITGVYNPYFTPANQRVHSGIYNASLQWRKVLISLNAAYGFFGEADNPFFYLDKNQNNEIFIQRDFANISFYPLELTGRLHWNISGSFNLETIYTHLKTIYFTSNSIQLGFKYRFIHAK